MSCNTISHCWIISSIISHMTLTFASQKLISLRLSAIHGLAKFDPNPYTMQTQDILQTKITAYLMTFTFILDLYPPTKNNGNQLEISCHACTVPHIFQT